MNFLFKKCKRFLDFLLHSPSVRVLHIFLNFVVIFTILQLFFILIKKSISIILDLLIFSEALNVLKA